MSGYLYFERTGHKEVDEILKAIEDAGDRYHHTSFWDESYDDKPSCLDIIDQKIALARIALE